MGRSSWGKLLTKSAAKRSLLGFGGRRRSIRQRHHRDKARRATEQPIDTSTAAGKCFLDMLGVFAEFETNLRRERQLEGIAKAKAAGIYKGRPPSIDVAQVRTLKTQGMGPTEIAKVLGIGRASVYRVLTVG
jgi:DNA invertase Pin-like site-specific DNA recombinase